MNKFLEIKYESSAPLTNDKEEQLFNKISDPLEISLYLIGKTQKICSITVNRKMMLPYSNFDRQNNEWKVSTVFNQPKFFKQQELQSFAKFVASGYLKIKSQEIAKYLLLACAFGSEHFVKALMKHKIQFRKKNQEIIGLIIKNYFDFLHLIKNKEKEFFVWLAQNNLLNVNIGEAVQTKLGNVAILLDAKGKAMKLSLKDISQLQDIVNTKVLNEQQQYRTFFQMVPWSYCSVQIVQQFRSKISPEDFIKKLNMISERISHKQSQIEKEKVNLKLQLEQAQTQLFIHQLEKLIIQQNLEKQSSKNGLKTSMPLNREEEINEKKQSGKHCQQQGTESVKARKKKKKQFQTYTNKQVNLKIVPEKQSEQRRNSKSKKKKINEQLTKQND